MKCQRNLVQTKIMNTPVKDTNEINLLNIPERDFKIKINNMLIEVQKNIQELRNKLHLEIQSLRNTMEGFKAD